MSKRVSRVAVLIAGLALSALAQAYARPQNVTVEVIDQQGVTFSQTPVRGTGKAYRAYLQAERGARYRIRVTNRSGDRVGIVVAVDGRNIISGARSELSRDEQMYILGPWATQEYSGWRTSLADVHEFYFTEWQDSYAEAFGDRSARGVIAVATYRESERAVRLREQARRDEQERMDEQERVGEQERRARSANKAAPMPSSPSVASAAGAVVAQDAAKAESRSEPGTGYGDLRNEPVVRVAFEAEPRATARVFLKYEWRGTLCRKGIVDCDDSGNRFWPDALSFAPPPPGR